MKITTVRYRRLVSGPGFTNTAVEAEAAVDEGETPEDALLNLSAWVRNQLGDGPLTLDPETLRADVDGLYRTRQQLRGAISGAEAEVRKLKDEIAALEIKREEAGGQSAIPF